MEDFNDFEDKAMNFLVKLRNENTFDDLLYNEIYRNLEKTGLYSKTIILKLYLFNGFSLWGKPIFIRAGQ